MFYHEVLFVFNEVIQLRELLMIPKLIDSDRFYKIEERE